MTKRQASERATRVAVHLSALFDGWSSFALRKNASARDEITGSALAVIVQHPFAERKATNSDRETCS